MNALMIASIVILVVVYALELVFAFLEKDNLRKIVKVMCLPALAFFAFALGTENLFVYLALCFGLIGDVLFLFKEKKLLFAFGLTAFALMHASYLYLLISTLEGVKAWHLIALGVFGLLFPLLPYKAAHPFCKKFTVPGTWYFYLIFMEILFAALHVFTGHSAGNVILLFGVCIFLVSDALVSFTTFVDQFKREKFYIMLTYLIAQTLLIIGFTFVL